MTKRHCTLNPYWAVFVPILSLHRTQALVCGRGSSRSWGIFAWSSLTSTRSLRCVSRWFEGSTMKRGSRSVFQIMQISLSSVDKFHISVYNFYTYEIFLHAETCEWDIPETVVHAHTQSWQRCTDPENLEHHRCGTYDLGLWQKMFVPSFKKETCLFLTHALLRLFHPRCWHVKIPAMTGLSSFSKM